MMSVAVSAASSVARSRLMSPPELGERNERMKPTGRVRKTSTSGATVRKVSFVMKPSRPTQPSGSPRPSMFRLKSSKNESSRTTPSGSGTK